jgi:ABC-type phosphate/phosphonate transport system substrate-binding protein
MSQVPITVGVVGYHPRVLTIWEAFRDYFERAGVPIDYVIYSNYERLVDSVLAGTVEIGWNTNTAFVALERQLGAQARILGMRDIDAQFASVIVTRRGEGLSAVGELAGRRLALGSRDGGHTAILPLYFLQCEGLCAREQCELIRFDVDLGKHGDTGSSELNVLRAVADGRADAGAMGDVTWVRFKSEGLPETSELELTWRSPTFYHCNFTALPSVQEERAERWRSALLAMSYDDPQMRQAMTLEGLHRWLPGDRSGYASLFAAVADGACL